MRFALFGFVLLFTLLAAVSPGKYEGNYSSEGAGGGGGLRVSLTEKDGSWTAEAGFDYDGAAVPCKVTKVEVTGDKVVVAYRFELGGYELESTLNGQTQGQAYAGSYQTKTPEGQGIDRGTFKLDRK